MKPKQEVSSTEDLDVVMSSEEAEWEEVRINTTKALHKNKVSVEIQEVILKLAESKLKGKA